MKRERIKRLPVEVNPVLVHPDQRRLSLDGEWEFQLDPEDEGVDRGWQSSESFDNRIQVPGCWQGQGFGGDGTDTVWDFRLHVRTFRATYEGTGWYGKTFEVPDNWEGSRIWINFGGVHPSAEIWLNGRKIGDHSGPFVPFGFEVTDLLEYDRGNRLCVRVFEGDRWLGHAYNWQGYWSGLYRSVELSATGNSWLERLWLYPELSSESLKVRILGGEADGRAEIGIKVISPDGGVVANERVALGPEGETLLSIPIESPVPWSPESPELYRVDAEMVVDGVVSDSMSTRMGFVELSTSGKHFMVNGEPYYIRGTGDFCSCPETGSPDFDRDRWRKKLATLRRFGYNQVRCQSYVPTPEYLDAADEVGLIVQLEMGMLGGWAGQNPWHRYAWPQPSPTYYPKLKQHWNLTVMRDVNHPSAAIYCMSNELGTATHYPKTAHECYRDTKTIKPGAMVIWTDGGYSPDLPADFVNAEARFDKECDLPVIQHEFRWWSAYPDVRIKDKFDGGLRPYPIELAEEKASGTRASGLLPKMADVSQRLQAIEMRGKMDACRRDNPKLSGISHFNAMDIGFSPQGVINEFFEEKLLDSDTWLRTWGDTVLLLDRNFDDRVLAPGDVLKATIYVSDFSHPPLDRPELTWEFMAGEEKVASGTISYRHRAFLAKRTGKIEVPIPEVDVPDKAVLRVQLTEGDRRNENEWSFWIFPGKPSLPGQVIIYGKTGDTWLRGLRNLPRKKILEDIPASIVVLTEQIDESLLDFVEKGGRAILAAGEGLIRPYDPKLGLSTGRYFFLPPANYPPYENGQSGTIIEDHPMLGDLPHEGFADLQLYRPTAESPPIDLRILGGWETRTVIRALSTYFVCYPLAYLVEFALGKGGIIISAMDLNQKWPESRYMLSTLIGYCAGSDFRPKNTLTKEGRESLLESRRN
jgi:hypothetical protein